MATAAIIAAPLFARSYRPSKIFAAGPLLVRWPGCAAAFLLSTALRAPVCGRFLLSTAPACRRGHIAACDALLLLDRGRIVAAFFAFARFGPLCGRLCSRRALLPVAVAGSRCAASRDRWGWPYCPSALRSLVGRPRFSARRFLVVARQAAFAFPFAYARFGSCVRFCFCRPLRSRFAAGRFSVVAVARAALPFSCFCPCGRFCFRRPALAVAVVASATTRAAALARAANALLCSCAIDAPFNVGGTTVREVIREPGKQAPRILDPATAPSRAG